MNNFKIFLIFILFIIISIFIKYAILQEYDIIDILLQSLGGILLIKLIEKKCLD